MEGFRLKDEKTRKEPTVDKGASQRSPMSVAGKPRTVCEELEKEDNKKSEPPSGTENREAAMATAQDILKEFAGQQGVEAVCLVGRDGFLLDSISRTGIDAETVGAIASTGFGSSESIGGQLGKGELNMSMIEFENGPVMFSPVGSDAFVVIIADKQANLGMIRLKLKKYSSELALAVSF
jgi:predicted regulator of Ras-like GTPase activity (Roadblock/LC7/MglB family)